MGEGTPTNAWLAAAQLSIGKNVQRLWPEQTVEGSGLALAEEAGEVCRALLKRNHGTKMTPEAWTDNLRTEVGQVVGVCLDIAYREGFDLAEVVAEVVWALAHREREPARTALPPEVDHG